MLSIGSVEVSTYLAVPDQAAFSEYSAGCGESRAPGSVIKVPERSFEEHSWRAVTAVSCAYYVLSLEIKSVNVQQRSQLYAF